MGCGRLPKTIKIVKVSAAHMQINAIKSCDRILIAARSWQWAVVARNKQNFTFISFNAGTVKEYTVTWIIFILPP